MFNNFFSDHQTPDVFMAWDGYDLRRIYFDILNVAIQFGLFDAIRSMSMGENRIPLKKGLVETCMGESLGS